MALRPQGVPVGLRAADAAYPAPNGVLRTAQSQGSADDGHENVLEHSLWEFGEAHLLKVMIEGESLCNLTPFFINPDALLDF